jgi:SAM-dependent methyltransferase
MLARIILFTITFIALEKALNYCRMKDNFSARSADYARFRPRYPEALFDFLLSKVEGRSSLWDVGTGNGQILTHLAKHFDQVLATDISDSQLKNAFPFENVKYRKMAAEDDFDPNLQFDVITVAQAIHWFKFDAFYANVKAHLRPGGVLTVLGYGLPSVNPEVDALVQVFYNTDLGPYWDPERVYVDENYSTIPFPFKEIETPQFRFQTAWSREVMIGYLSTWSALQHYNRQHDHDLLGELNMALAAVWPEEELKEVVFPVLFRLGEMESKAD